MSDPATLDTIDDALFAALQTLGPTAGGGAGRFEVVDRVAEELTPEACAEITGNATTAVLLFAQQSDPLPDFTVQTLLAGTTETASRSYWIAYVVVRDPRTDAAAVKSAGSQAGTLALVAAVTTALTGLRIDGLEGSTNVAYRGRKALRGTRGQFYAWQVRVSADHVDDQQQPPLAGAPLTEIDVDFDVAGDADPATNPLVRTKTTF